MENGALDAMLDAIRETASGEGQAEFSRNRIIVLLDVIAEHLDPMLEQPVTQDDNCEVVAEHAAVGQLRALVSALRDLDTGLTDPIFKAYEHGANATLPWDVRASDEALIEAMAVYQNKYKLTQIAAASRLAADLAANGFRRKGKVLNGKSLQRLKYGSATGFTRAAV